MNIVKMFYHHRWDEINNDIEAYSKNKGLSPIHTSTAVSLKDTIIITVTFAPILEKASVLNMHENKGSYIIDESPEPIIEERVGGVKRNINSGKCWSCGQYMEWGHACRFNP